MYSIRMLSLLALVVFSLDGWAIGDGQSAYNCDPTKKECKDAIIEIENARKSGGEQALCSSLADKVADARKEFEEKCIGAKVQIGDCVSRIETCSNQGMDAFKPQGSYSTVDSILNGMMSSQDTSGEFCADKSSADAKKDKDDANKRTNDLQESMRKSKEAAQEAQNKFLEKKNDFESQSIQLLKEIEETEIGKIAEVRKMINESENTKKALANKILETNRQMVGLKQAILAMESEKVAALEKVLDDCDDKLDAEKEKLRSQIDDMKRNGQYKVSGGARGLGGAKAFWREKLKGMYSKCIARANKTRKLLASAYQSKYANAQADLKVMENKIADFDEEIQKEKVDVEKRVRELEGLSDTKRDALLKTLQLSSNRLVELKNSADQAQQNISQQDSMTMMQMMLSGQSMVGSSMAYPSGVKNPIGDAQGPWAKYEEYAKRLESKCNTKEYSAQISKFKETSSGNAK